MHTITVQPMRRRGEFLFVIMVTLGIVVGAGVLIVVAQRTQARPGLKYFQISAFSGLNSLEQGLFMDLYTSAFDIEMYHRENREEWPDIQTLDANLIAPFTIDAVWEQRGRHQWAIRTMDIDNVHRSLYIGTSADSSLAGSFVLFFEHFHTMDGAYFNGINKRQPFGIWFKQGAFNLPDEVTDGTLVSAGWKEVVPFRGKDLLQRAGRDDTTTVQEQP